MKKNFLFSFLFLCFSITFIKADLLPFTAKVIGIKDGDTFTVLHQKQMHTVRLAHIDCPEKKQAFGTKAKQFASDLCFGKMARVLPQPKKDRNGRIIAEIWVGKICVNKELVKNGLAWHYKRYSSDSEYTRLELQARQLKRGLWKDPYPIPPWQWRKNKR